MNILSCKYLGIAGLVIVSASSLVAQQAPPSGISGQPSVKIAPSENVTESALLRSVRQALTSGVSGQPSLKTVPSENVTESAPERLKGRYMFYATGTQAGLIGFPKVAMMGSFAADGKGHITGIMDFNSANQPFTVTAERILGTYTLSRDGIGTLNLKSSELQLTFAINMSTTAEGRANVGALVETDNIFGTSGSINQQNLPISVKDVYRVSLSGQVPVSDNPSQSEIFITMNSSGTITFTGEEAHGPFSLSIGVQSSGDFPPFGPQAENIFTVDITATATKPDDDGRFSMSWTDSLFGITSNFVCYVVNDNEFRLIEMDPPSDPTFPLGTGTAVK
jgi:hypothetical protein